MPQNTRSRTPRTIELGQVRPVAELGLSRRAVNTLLRHGVNTVGQLIARSSDDLYLELHGLGEISLKEIEDALAGQGLSLSPQTSTFRYVRKPLRRHVRNHNMWQHPQTSDL
jgi:DNA-directed RNA polymerase alpha subunit